MFTSWGRASVIYKWIVKCKVNCKVNSGFWGITSIFLGLQINIWIAYYCEFTLILIVHDHALWKWILAARAWLTLLCAVQAAGRARFHFMRTCKEFSALLSVCGAARGGRLADRRLWFISQGVPVQVKSEIIHFHSEFHFCLARFIWWWDGGSLWSRIHFAIHFAIHNSLLDDWSQCRKA